MESKLITEIIGKFLKGNCNDEEFAYLLHWYESFDEKEPLPLSEEEKELLKKKILARIRLHIPELGLKNKNTAKVFAHRVNIIRIWKYAAAVAVLVLIAWFSFRLYEHKPSDIVKESQHLNHPSNLVVLSNHTNRIYYLVLSDGSKVWLNPESSLRFPEKFSGKERNVMLKGEAFFEINKDPLHPFIVTSGNISTTVLGTSFLIKADKNSQDEVTVLSGKVSVEKIAGEKDKVILVAKQSAVLNANDKLIREAYADKNILQRWQNVNLSFNNVPFEQVMQTLDQKFGVQMHCEDAQINQYKLNADFSNQNLTNILEMLEKSLNISYEMANDSVINFYGNKN